MDLTLAWQQYPSWVNGAFTEWIWHLKTDPATSRYFTRVRFDGPEVLPPPSAVTPKIMREYASVHNSEALVYSADLSGFSTSWAVEQKGLTDYAENACLDVGNPRGPLHPRTFLLMFYRPDALAALRAAATTAAAAAAAAGPPEDWDGLLTLLEAHAAAVRADASSSGGIWSAGALESPSTLPQYGLCINTHPTCGRLNEVFAAIAASVVQTRGTQQGYVFDLPNDSFSALPKVGGPGWRHAADILRRLLEYNAPDYIGGDTNITAATNCRPVSPWFMSGNCLVTIEFDTAFMSMGVPPLNASGALGVSVLPGSRRVETAEGSGLENCTRATCAVSANHDLLYLAPAGQQPAVLAAAKAAAAGCGAAEAARMQAAAVAAAKDTGTAASDAVVNRAPYSAVYEYFAYINYEMMGMVQLGQEMAIIQLAIASRLTNERTLRQNALNEIRSAAASSVNVTNALSSITGDKWSSEVYAATPWWASPSGSAGAAGGWAPPASALASFAARGLEGRVAAEYVRALWHGVHSPNGAPDIASPAMINWFKWGLGHAALSLLPPQPAAVDEVAELLRGVFGQVIDAHSSTSVRRAYELAIQSEQSMTTEDGGSGSSGLSAGARAALYSSIICGTVVGCILLVLLARLRNRRRDLLGRVRAPRAGPDTTLLISDVQSSTKLWEQLPVAVMDESLKLHHSTFRRLLPKFNGYESATEGDSFILAFADPASAVAFASACQVTLLLQSWPQELLEHPDGATLLVTPTSDNAAEQAGVPAAVMGRISGRSKPAPGSLASSLTWPARYISARVRVAASRRSGSSLAMSRPVPQPLRTSANGMYGVGPARELSYDGSVRGGAYGSQRSVECSPLPLPAALAASAAEAALGTRSLAPATPTAASRGGQPAAAGRGEDNNHALGSQGGELAATAAAAINGPTGGGEQECSTADALTTPKADSLIKGSTLLSTGGGPAMDSWDMTRTEAGIASSRLPIRSSSKLCMAHDGSSVFSPSSVGPEAAGAVALGLSPQQAALRSGTGTYWAAALQAVFPPLAPGDLPAAVGGHLKGTTVVLPGGRLAVVAYRGLRVRMGLHTGLDDPQHIAFNKVGSTFKYYGPFAETTKTAIGAAPGGMVVLTEPAFTRLRHCIARRRHESVAWQREYGAVVVYGGHHVMPSSDHPAPPVAAKGERPAAARGVQINLGGDLGGNATPSPRTGVATGEGREGDGEGGGGDGDGGGATTVLVAPAPGDGVALFQAVPSTLVCRLGVSQPLVSERVAQLGSLAAPVGCITVAFMYVVGASTLLADLPGPASRALEQFQRLACGLLAAKCGYLVEGGDGLLLAAFGCPLAGVEWALDCVAGLKELEWEEDLLGHWLCEEVLSVGVTSAGLDAEQLGGGGGGSAPGTQGGDGAAPLTLSASRRAATRSFDRLPSMARMGTMAHTQRVLERGLRIKAGLDTGRASHWLTDASGRLSYRGKVMNRASRVAGKAAAGQVVCTDVTWDGCMEAFEALEASGDVVLSRSGRFSTNGGAGLVGMSLGKVLLRGVTSPVELIQCMRN